MRLTRIACIFLAASPAAHAQRGGWSTFAGDAQRSGWNKAEATLTPQNVKGLKLEWSLKLDATSRQLNSLTVPVVRGPMITPTGFRELVFVAAASDKVYAIDADFGKIYWEKSLSVDQAAGGSWLCPNAVNATPMLGLLPTLAAPGRGAAPATPAPAPGRGGPPGQQAMFVIGSDGKIRAFHLVTGEEVLAPTALVPPNAKPWSLNVMNNVIYTTTGQGCGGARSGVWSIDLADPARKVASFHTSVGSGQAGVWGRSGAAITSDGRIVIATGDGAYDPSKGQFADTVLVLSADLKLLDYYTPTNRAWITRKDLDMGTMSPVVFPFKNWELVAAAGKEGRIYLLDSKSLGGADHNTPLYRSPLWANEEANFAGRGYWGAMSTWEDPSGTRWLYAPAWGPPTADAKFPASIGATPHGSVMAFKIEVQDGKPIAVPAWNSVDMSTPTPVVIANGMVIAMSDGDYSPQSSPTGGLLNTEQRRTQTGNTVIYVLDAQTGKTLWSSGTMIKGFSHFLAPAVAGGRIYAVTHDNTVWAFGLGMEH